MFIQKAALRRAPSYATVPAHALELVESSLDHDAQDLQETLDRGHRQMERQQSHLSEWLAEQISDCDDELAQSLGYFLGVTVFLAFFEAFSKRLSSVSPDALKMVLKTFDIDEELRAADPNNGLGSDDVIGLSQPVLVEYVQHHMGEALEQAGEHVNTQGFDDIYRAVLVQIIALSYAVQSPEGMTQPALDVH